MSCDQDFSSNLQEQKDEILALQSIFNTDDDDKLKVLSDATDDAANLFSLMVVVSVKPEAEHLTIDIFLPPDQEEAQGAMAAPDVPILPKNIQLNRSVSGARWTGSFAVKYLSPIMLYVRFPHAYPSCEPPSLHFACAWLSSQQSESLSAMLKQLWEESSNMPVLYTWIHWLENNTLAHLAISDHLTLQFSDHQPANHEHGESGEGYNLHDEIGEALAAIIQYNRGQMDIEFCQNSHVCEVCYDEKQGIQFFRMHDCHHKFCHECMMAYCEFHVTAGTVEELRCPDTECNTLLPPYILQAVLDPVNYDKWEKLLLQKTLDSMSDTVYCPRCQSLVISEEEELRLAHCTVCLFAFCTECNRVWHQGSDCQTDEDVLENIVRKGNQLNAAEDKKLQELIRKVEEEIASKERLRSANIRKCPCCKVQVEKIGGCNKMTCKCSAIFCWLCGKAISGYSHYTNSQCVLFPGQAGPPALAGDMRQPPRVVLEMRARIAVNPDLRNKQSQCPNCKQTNLKDGSNNHIKCWNCKSNFCFLCNQRIVKNITLHFQGLCTQHS